MKEETLGFPWFPQKTTNLSYLMKDAGQRLSCGPAAEKVEKSFPSAVPQPLQMSFGLPHRLQTGSSSLERSHLHPWRSSPGSRSAKPSCPLLPALDAQKNQRVCQERTGSPFKAHHSFLLNLTIRADRSLVGCFLSFDVFLRSSLLPFLGRLVCALLESVRASPLQNRRMAGFHVSAPSDLDCAEGRVMTPPEALVNGCQFVGRLLPEVQQCCLKVQPKPRT